MRAAEFEFNLPPELIAQTPANQRDASRLLTLNRATKAVTHRQFSDLPNLLVPGDLLIINNSRVIRARLHGLNAQTNGRFEVLLLEEVGRNDWWALCKPGRRASIGTKIRLLDTAGNVTEITASVTEINPEGHRRFQFEQTSDLRHELDRLGEIPLPPYIRRSAPDSQDLERYQTVFAQNSGSLAAPTAGLHFTPQLVAILQAKGICIAEVTLHVGLGTFAPVKAECIADHVMHEETYEVSTRAAAAINDARAERRRVIAIGTTSLRVIESVGRQNDGRMVAGSGRTRIFIRPPDRITMADALLTNFHLPRSTLLMLVSTFAAPGELHGRDLILDTYAAAVQERYRFFSYGDAMLIT